MAAFACVSDDEMLLVVAYRFSCLCVPSDSQYLVCMTVRRVPQHDGQSVCIVGGGFLLRPVRAETKQGAVYSVTVRQVRSRPGGSHQPRAG